MRRSARSTARVGGALAAALLATVSGAAVAPPAAAAAQEQSAVTALIRQSEFWRGRGRKDLAQAAMQKAMVAGPRNPDVLAAMARFAAEDGDRGAADRWIAQLRAVAPGDPRIGALATAQRATPPAAGLAEARRLAQAGQGEQAVAAYRALFGGQAPPETYRLEYYQTLSGAPATWDEGRDGLQRLLAARPDDPAVKLAYAQALTYRESTRRDGIARLAALRALPPATSQPAVRAWRQALLWLGARPADRQLYQSFLTAMPNDAEVQAKLGAIDTTEKQADAARTATPVDRGAPLRQDGFAALDKNNDAAAQQKFEAALKLKANDADALGGLGLVKLRAQDFAAARIYLQKAIDAAPANAGRWREALASAKFFTDFRAAQAAGQQGDFARAEALARPLAGQAGPDQAISRELLADTLAREGKAAEAETVYRQVLAARPDDADARAGLMQALLAQSRFAEAEALASTPNDRGALSDARGRIELARANQLWSNGDVTGANAAFEQALAARPTDPWTRYDFARFLDGQGQAAAADGLIQPLPGAGTPESLYVAALYAQRRNQAGDAYTLISQIPPAQRTVDMNRLLGELRVDAVIEQAGAARTAGRNLEALSTLRTLLAQPGLTVGAQSQIASALYDLGDGQQAMAMAQQALIQPKAAPGAYGGYVSVLAKAGHDAEAMALIRQLAAQPGAATADSQRAIVDLEVAFAAERADRQRLAGDFAGAFDTLSATFAQAPNNQRLLASLARLYQSGGMGDRAGAAYEQLLRLNPGDQDALVGVTRAAIARQDWPRARQTLAMAMSHAPTDPNLYVLSADIEQGAGDKRAALKALEAAKTLRQRQFASTPVLPGAGAPLPGAAFGAGVLGPNPFAPGAGAIAPTPQRQAFQPTVAMSPMPAILAAPIQGRLTPVAWATTSPAASSLPTPPIATSTATTPGLGYPALPTAPPYAQPSAALYAPPAAGYAPNPTYRPPPGYAPSRAYPPAAAYTPAPSYPLPPVPQPAPPPSFAAPYADPFSRGEPQSVAQAAPFAASEANPFAAPPKSDPLIAAIDQRIASISNDTRSSAEAQVGFRGRSGEAGLSQLSELDAQVSLTVSPFSAGKLTVAIKPVNLDAGTASGDSLTRVGGNPLTLATNLVNLSNTPLRQPGAQSASGVGVDVGYQLGPVAADLEATPLGFGSVEAGGGLSWSPRLGRNGVAKLWVERRAVTDSLTSYAGSKDSVTGIRWGQVMRSTAGVSLSYDTGRSGVYADFADSDYHGRHTEENSSYQFNVGAYIRPIQAAGEQLQVGVNLNHQAYDNNQNHFTVGNGGYFSPKSFTNVAIPVEYKKTSGLWQLDLFAAPGYQTYVEESSLYFPRDPDLQGTLDVLTRFNAEVPTTFAGSSQSGLGILAKGKVEYAFQPNLAVGAQASFNNVGAYRETQGGLYVRQLLGGGS